MNKDDFLGIGLILGIIAIGLIGGAKNKANSVGPLTTEQIAEQKQADIQTQVIEAQKQVDDLKVQIQAAEDAKTNSKYKSIVHMQYVSRSSDPNQEYITIRVDSGATGTIPITGWRIESKNSGMSVSVPQGTTLFFTGTINTKENVYLTGGDTAYVITGISPLGISFRTNKCSGYLSQFQTFSPYMNSNCPAPRDEDLSSIPKRTINDACFDYIDSYPTCKMQVDPLPRSFSVECTDFITNKLNYNSCVNTHKIDKDFNTHTWYLYLARSEKIWKDRRENIVLYDTDNKIVDSLIY